MQVVLFGSFTEDEAKLFQGQPVTETKSEEKACELPEIQFGSLNFSMASLEKVSAGAVHSPNSTSGHVKDHACSNKKETAGSSLPNGGPVLINGCPTVVSPNNGGLKNVKSEATVPSARTVSNVKETEAVVPSAGPVSNGKKTDASVPSAGPVKNVKKTEAPVPSAGPVKNVKKTEATILSAGPVKNVKKTEATVPSAGHANNVKKTEAKAPSPGPVNNVKKTEPVVPPGVSIKNISSSTPTQGRSSAMQVTENGSTGVDAPIVAAPVDESIPSLDKEACQNKQLLPHGLKNTGNICFLNATLQALLSCLPFVQLVKDLRNQSIPKVLLSKRITSMFCLCLYRWLLF
jgi:ubiquitin carboxyl-terminal hydrolase 10